MIQMGMRMLREYQGEDDRTVALLNALRPFILLIMGFGCNVLAVMATRTIESRSSRMITMLALKRIQERFEERWELGAVGSYIQAIPCPQLTNPIWRGLDSTSWIILGVKPPTS